jgi:hypothetical protein
MKISGLEASPLLDEYLTWFELRLVSLRGDSTAQRQNTDNDSYSTHSIEVF